MTTNLSTPLPQWAVGALALAVGVALGLLIALGWRWYQRRRRERALHATVTAIAVDHLKDVLVPDGNGGFVHIDYVLLTIRGLVVLDIRDVRGNVFGSDQMNAWTVMARGRRFTFPNPQPALYDRIAAVRQYAGAQVPVDGRIVFLRRATFPKGLPRFTIGIDSLSSEFPLPDRDSAERSVAALRDGWDKLRSEAAPSPLVNARDVVDG
jgi:hypothetical protein